MDWFFLGTYDVHADETDRMKKNNFMIDKMWIVGRTMPLRFLSRPVSEHSIDCLA